MTTFAVFHLCSTSSGTVLLQSLYRDFLGNSFSFCSGTQVEHFDRVPVVPLRNFRPEHKWNSANPYWAWLCGVLFHCSTSTTSNDQSSLWPNLAEVTK